MRPFGPQQAPRATDRRETHLLLFHREAIPEPTQGEGTFVDIPTADALKVRVCQALRASGVKRSELARRLGQHAPQVDRLLDLRHASKVDQLDAALRAVGKRLVFGIEPADEDTAVSMQGKRYRSPSESDEKPEPTHPLMPPWRKNRGLTPIPKRCRSSRRSMPGLG
jgi:hypothetical protein